jgi:hypothetical protein
MLTHGGSGRRLKPALQAKARATTSAFLGFFEAGLHFVVDTDLQAVGISFVALIEMISMLRFGFFRNSRAGLAAPNDPKT